MEGGQEMECRGGCDRPIRPAPGNHRGHTPQTTTGHTHRSAHHGAQPGGGGGGTTAFSVARRTDQQDRGIAPYTPYPLLTPDPYPLTPSLHLPLRPPYPLPLTSRTGIAPWAMSAAAHPGPAPARLPMAHAASDLRCRSGDPASRHSAAGSVGAELEPEPERAGPCDGLPATAWALHRLHRLHARLHRLHAPIGILEK